MIMMLASMGRGPPAPLGTRPRDRMYIRATSDAELAIHSASPAPANHLTEPEVARRKRLGGGGGRGKREKTMTLERKVPFFSPPISETEECQQNADAAEARKQL